MTPLILALREPDAARRIVRREFVDGATLEEAVRTAVLAESENGYFDTSDAGVQGNIDRDTQLLEQVLERCDVTPTVRLWVNSPCIVVSRHTARKPNFEVAARAMAEQDIAVAIRISGGETVVHRSGVLNLTMILPGWGENISISRGYGSLINLLKRSLHRLGLHTVSGAVPDAYCDGNFNLVWKERKLAGTAAAAKTRNGAHALMVHASLVLWGDLSTDAALVSRFDSILLGTHRRYDAQAHASVALALGIELA